MADDPKTYEPNQVGSMNPEVEPKEDVSGVGEKRKPGRPAKAPPTTPNTNYTPSIDRNEDHQAAQPTGTKGKDAVAGGGDWADFDESKLEDVGEDWNPVTIDNRLSTLVKKENDSPPPIPFPEAGEKLFPVRILRNYRPATDRWYPILRNGKVGKPPRNEDGTATKIMKGYSVLLPLSEAKEVVRRGIGERADALPE